MNLTFVLERLLQALLTLVLLSVIVFGLARLTGDPVNLMAPMEATPEDIAQLFEMAPIGTQVRVVNQPYVFGWHEGALHIQAFDVLEDDPRDWKKAQAKLLNKAMAEASATEAATPAAIAL